MIGPQGNVRVYLACGATDMRKGFDTLAAQVQRKPPAKAVLRGDVMSVLLRS
jgi:transposase